MSVRQSKKMKALPQGHVRCSKCKGKGKLYKVAENVYMRVNAGGRLAICPLCAGEGHIMTLEAKAKELKENERRERAKASPKKKIVSKKGSEDRASD